MARLIFAKLADPASFLPMPDRDGRPFAAAGENINADDPFWMACLADKSVEEAKPDAPAITPDPKKKGE